ncbi:MAG: cob(I)yrinic acid a,c-diamide adenosyltransferase [Desulfobacterales bacterium]|nr:cob(I)yrinic acid a,c-diamide adenosyltransferase [Desulfobacterales bacterium]
MKIYTGTGDRGKTSLFSGERIEKSDIRVEAYGDVDELSALIGSIPNALPPDCDPEAAQLEAILTDLFHAGACLASTPGSQGAAAFQDLPAERVAWLEQAIDRLDDELPRLKRFILPVGHPAACACHVARCVCRRAERHIVRLCRENAAQDENQEYSGLQSYLNRLSDYLFVLARYCNHVSGTTEKTWKG